MRQPLSAVDVSSSAPMTLRADPTQDERAQNRDGEARALPDTELESRLVEAEHAVAGLRRQFQDALAWRDALDAERDRRSVQRRVGPP